MTQAEEVPMHHHPSTEPMPLLLADPRVSKDVQYRRRTNAPKSAIHWGQRKLLLSEVQFLSLYTNPKHSKKSDDTPVTHEDPCCLVVYAGSAPGTHLSAMPLIFPTFFQNFHFELHDPRQFDASIYAWAKRCAPMSRGGVSVHNGYFTDATAVDVVRRRMHKRRNLQFLFASRFCDKAEEQAAETPKILEQSLFGFKTLCYAAAEDVPLLFISDIRTGSLAAAVEENDFDMQYKNEKFEKEVKMNMDQQQRWHQIMQPQHSMLKFRLPYVDDNETLSVEDRTTVYLSGDVVLPLWTRPTSSECRVITRRTTGSSSSETFPPISLQPYDNAEYQNQLYFFNTFMREGHHYNHFYDLGVLNTAEALAKKARTGKPRAIKNHDLDHRYDASMELSVLASAVVLERRAAAGMASPDNLAGEEKYRWLLGEAASPFVEGGKTYEIYNAALLLSQAITREIRRTFDNAIRAREEIILEKARAFSWTKTALSLIQAQRVDRERPQWWKNVEE